MLSEIGRKLYYQKSNGYILVDTGEMVGELLRETTTEEDFIDYLELQGKNPDAVGCFKIPFGEYKTEFDNRLPFSIQASDGTIVFDYTKLKDELQTKIATHQQQIASLEDELAKLE